MGAKEMDTQEKDNIIRDMYSTLLNHEHGREMERNVICMINSIVPPLILKKFQSCDAEKLMTILNIIFVRSKLTTITIYINDSPCHTIAPLIIKFLNENPNVISILYVTNLNKIRRMSCIFEPHYRGVSSDTHEANVTGLQNLMAHSRCVVSAFSHAVWSELLSIVGVSKELKSELLDGYNTKFDKNDRSREEEDNRIRSDLVCIRCIPPAFQHQIEFP